MEKIFESFKTSFERDKSKFINNWLVKWDYQVKRKKRKVAIEKGEPENFFIYNGPNDLAEWFNWLKEPSPDYLGNDSIDPLIKLSFSNDKKVIENLDLKVNLGIYRGNIGTRNAHDFLFPNLYPNPSRFKIKNILDFGAGYGRQANLWTSKLDSYTFVGMDAVPKSYCLQNTYYKALGRKVIDYVEENNFKINFEENCIYHLPTWRYDLLPSNSFDLVMCVQVLPELNSTLVKKMIGEFHRILKPGAMLYLNDHGEKWKPGGRLNIDQHILESGFVLEFKPHVIDDVDIHGIPRIFRKINSEVIESQRADAKRKIRQELENVDAVLGGSLSKVSQTIRKMRNK
jgi:SAM-dependent methyltransferase